MAYQGITTGTSPNDGTGDSLLTGALKISSNFEEIYNALGDGTNITIDNKVQDIYNAIGDGTNITIDNKVQDIYNAIGDGTNITINSIVPVESTDIDCSIGNYFTKTVSSNTTFSFSNVPSGEIYSLTIKIIQNSGNIIWPNSVRWPNDEEPLPESGFTHLFMFMTDNNGSTWRGAALLNYSS